MKRKAASNKGWTNTQKDWIKEYGVSGLLVTKLWVRHHGDEFKIQAALRRHVQYRKQLKEARQAKRFITSQQFQAAFGPAEGTASELQELVHLHLNTLALQALPGFLVPDRKLSLLTGNEGTPLTFLKVMEIIETHVIPKV